MNVRDLLKKPLIELPKTLSYFSKDPPGWRFAVVVVHALVPVCMMLIWKLF